jgi:hypothetical protein
MHFAFLTPNRQKRLGGKQYEVDEDKMNEYSSKAN